MILQVKKWLSVVYTPLTQDMWVVYNCLVSQSECIREMLLGSVLHRYKTRRNLKMSKSERISGTVLEISENICA